MSFLSDLLLATATLGAGFFCWVLSRRLARLTALDSGLGKAIAILSAQVDDLSQALVRAQASAEGSAGKLDDRLRRADEACRQLDLMLAALHDLPERTPARRPDEPRVPPADESVFPGARPPSPWPVNRRDDDPNPAVSSTPAGAAPIEPADARTDSPAARARVLRRRSAVG